VFAAILVNKGVAPRRTETPRSRTPVPSPEGRAYVTAWLVKHFNDSGGMFSPHITQERRKVTIDNETFWLVRLPKSQRSVAPKGGRSDVQ
jgi:cytochrome oxidase assembly protein ShyY1